MMFKAWCRYCDRRIRWHEGRRVWRRLSDTHVSAEVCPLAAHGWHDPDPSRP
jgi:hypothetical protein